MSGRAKHRIYQALKRTLEQHLEKELRKAGAESGAQAIRSPWNMLINERDAWGIATSLDRKLYSNIRGQFDNNLVKEILLATAGIKVSRTLVSEETLRCLHEIGTRHGFCVLASDERYVYRCDIGKGGFSNVIERSTKTDEADTRRIVYIASDETLAATAKLLEEAGDDELFGLLLGIPACCRAAYQRFQPRARAKQNDCIPLVLDNTEGTIPYDSYLNFAAIYFGPALLSFFPCSFRCPKAAFIAKTTFELLAKCDPSWAHSFLEAQRTNILYSEYRGIHLIRSPYFDGSIRYNHRDLDSTEHTQLAQLIGRGDRLMVRGKHHVDVYRGPRLIGVAEGEDVSMCVFW